MQFNTKNNFNTLQVANHEQEKSYRLTKELDLYSAVVTAVLNDKFYEGSTDRLDRFRELITINEPGFVARLAIYAREQMYLRSIPLVLAVELAKLQTGSKVVGKLVARVIQRADEITEILAYYSIANKRTSIKKLNKLSKQLQKGLAISFNRFDEYQFGKYKRKASIRLKDALFIIHPKAKDVLQQELFNKIANDQLAIPYTWEVELSALGREKYDTVELKQDALRAKWEELIMSGKLGYMATLRNLRAMLKAKVSDAAIHRVSLYLSDPIAVAKSKQLPFRFLAAWREIRRLPYPNVSLLLNSLEDAVSHSAINISGFDATQTIVVAADVSGSMQTPISAKSSIQNYDIGLMLAMMLQSRTRKVIAGMFGSDWKIINLPQQHILANVDEYRRREGEVGYSTNGYLVIRDLLYRKVIVDKVMLFTDAQLWNSGDGDETLEDLWIKYKSIAANARLYLFDLSGYGNTPLNVLRDDVYLIAGWSDRIFGVLDAIEKGNDAVHLINEIDL